MRRFLILQILQLLSIVLLQAKTVKVINGCLDLKGEHLVLRNGEMLKFEKGSFITNGIVVGNESSIETDVQVIFDRSVSIEGTWKNDKVFGQWVDLREGVENNQSFRNLMNLCAGSRLSHLYTPAGTYPVSAVVFSAPILLPSNVYWHNSSTIKLMPCNFTHYSIVLIHNMKNVTIDGGEFIGDVITHTGTRGEWGHGIKIGGSTNVTLKNLTCSYCWGDGIDLIEGRDADNQPVLVCNKITIDNVKSLHNRRQGMSIEAAHNVIVQNSEFAYTGVPLSTKPSAGLDIEEWNADGHKMNYLLFKNCTFHDNVGFDMQSEPNWKMGREEYKCYENNVSFVSCSMDSCRVTYTNGIRFDDCVILDMCVHYSNDVVFDKCRIEKLIKSKNDSEVKFKKCKGKGVAIDYTIPVGIVGLGSLLCFGCYFIYKGTYNEIDRNHNNS